MRVRIAPGGVTRESPEKVLFNAGRFVNKGNINLEISKRKSGYETSLRLIPFLIIHPLGNQKYQARSCENK